MKVCLKYCLMIILLFSAGKNYSQNIEKIGKEDMFRISGGMNLNSIFYDVSGMDSRRDPFTWYASGNLNINIIDFNIPLNYSYSNQKGKFTQPFNQFSLSPYYKWVKTQIGYSSVNYSSYTLAGHLFLGGALDLTPKNWEISLMYGRLKKAISFDSALQNEFDFSYRRMGMAAKAGYEKNGNSIYITGFSAQDDPNSVLFIPLNTIITPQQNIVFGSNGKIKITKELAAEAEFAVSGINRNINEIAQITSNENIFIPHISSFIKSSAFYAAYKGAVNYQYKKFAVKAQYEHVDPDYMTLGMYFINNDLENYTLAPSISLLKGKLSIAANSGLQRNNLKSEKLSTTNRWVGSANINFSPNARWNLSCSFSNFTTFTKNRPNPDPYFINLPDTLNFYQVSRSANFTVSKQIGKKTIKQMLLFSGNYSESNQVNGNISDPGFFGNVTSEKPMITLNGNLNYSMNFLSSKTAIAIGVNSNYSQFNSGTTLFIGPNLNFSQPLFQSKIKFSAGSAFNQAYNNEISSGSVFNHRVSFSHSTKKAKSNSGKLTTSVSSVLMQRFTNTKTITEFTGTINMNYNF